MISSRKLIKMARKWQKLTAEKCHFDMYTADRRRFVVPLVYLNNDNFRELLKIAEEEYGLSNDQLITLPFDAVFMEYAISLIRSRAANYLEKALLASIASGYCLRSPFSYLQPDKSINIY